MRLAQPVRPSEVDGFPGGMDRLARLGNGSITLELSLNRLERLVCIIRGVFMAHDEESKMIVVCGKRWKIVTNETHTRASYPLHDVIICRGDKPDFVST